MPHVLIVEDHRDLAELIALQARLQQCEPTVASDAFGALEAMRARRFDLVILDHHMPGMTGLQLLRLLAVGGVVGMPAKVIVHSADEAARADAIALGAAAFVHKSGDLNELGRLIALHGGCGEQLH